MTNKAASELAKLRWAGTTKAERAKQMPKGAKRGRPPRKYPKCPAYRAHVFNPRTGVCYGRNCNFVKPQGEGKEK